MLYIQNHAYIEMLYCYYGICSSPNVQRTLDVKAISATLLGPGHKGEMFCESLGPDVDDLFLTRPERVIVEVRVSRNLFQTFLGQRHHQDPFNFSVAR